MGHTLEARCLDCGHSFSISRGGGFFFNLLRCDGCGETKSIQFDELGGDLPVRGEEYNRKVEAFAGKCECGGQFLFDAPPRCLKCRSTHIEEGKITIMYD